MRLREGLRRVAETLAPRACSHCDGGSGVVEDQRFGTLKRCPQCQGTGLAAHTLEADQEAVDARLDDSNSRRPSNVA